MANARPKPNIPMVGLRTSPDAASTSSAPTIGPVQENETITVVSPMKNDASKPPLSALESAPATHLLGRTISNAPKKDIANRTNREKKSILGIQCVLRVLAKPAPALVRETITPSDEYMSIIDNPKINAFNTALPRFSEAPEKKATVTGIIGKTQGVRIPAKPARREIRKNLIKPLFVLSEKIPDFMSPPEEVPETESAMPKINSNSTSLGGEQVTLLHDIKFTLPRTVADGDTRTISWRNSALLLKVLILNPNASSNFSTGSVTS